MKSVSLSLISSLALAGAVYGQVPSTNDTSDSSANTGSGYDALSGSGVVNSPCSVGEAALTSSRCFNTAFGNDALALDTIGGNYNTGVGTFALYQNTSGYYNTATGAGALEENTTGDNNTAIGFGALSSNILGNNGTYSTGSFNTAVGAHSLYVDTTGSNNTASGYEAMRLNTTGSNNIAIGYEAGLNLTTGSNNIAIGNKGSASDANVIKIGTEGTQSKTFIAGIYNESVAGSAVMIDSSGHLGVVVSSERFKTGIAPIGSDTAKLQELRPIKFHLKTEPLGVVQYGLIAEEVAKVYPELVIRGENNRIDGVRYDELAPMLLNEVQKQQRTARAQAEQMVAQAAEIASFKQQLSVMQAALVKLQAKDALLAQR